MLTFETRLTKAEWNHLSDAFCRKEKDIELLYDALFSLSPKQVRQQYAGYVLLHVHRKCPSLLTPKLKDFLSLLTPGAKVHISIPRQVFSIFQDRQLPEDLAGEVFAKAVDHFLDTSNAIAIRARALQTCENVANQYDGLWPEIYELATSIQPQDSSGLRNIGRRVVKKALKMIEKAQ